MTSHKWKKDKDGAESCERVGCTVRKTDEVWQRKKGAHWRLVSRQPIPPCTGKDALPGGANLIAHTSEDGSRWQRTPSLDVPAPSTLEVVLLDMLPHPIDCPWVSLRSCYCSTGNAIAMLEESVRADEREKCARDVDTVASGYGSLQRQALAHASRELRLRNRQ